ncbi:MAG: hypothetical protein WCI43_01535 [Candidatus Firestonebacteria bacterium]
MKKFWIILAVIAAVAVVLVGGFIFMVMPKAPDLKAYQHLTSPEIVKMERQKMLCVELTGDPSKTSMRAIPALFKTYFSLKGVDRSKAAAPRARWTADLKIPADQWVGNFGLPVPEEVIELPEQKGDLKLELKYWEYGEVAQILHIGAYSDEAPTVDLLQIFAKERGYKLVGLHEEEYLKGPGMFFKGDSKQYQTVIRYRLEKLKVVKKAPAKIVKAPAKKKTKTKTKK